MKKLALFIIGLSINAFAHPHYFLDSTIQISENNIKNQWKFDRLNSKILTFDFDKNKNKVLDSDEKEEFFKAHFYKLSENNYNIFLTNDEIEYKVQPQNLDLLVDDKKRLTIFFDIPYELSSDTTFCSMDEKILLAYKLEKLETNLKTDIQKSEYDFCIGVSK